MEPKASAAGQRAPSLPAQAGPGERRGEAVPAVPSGAAPAPLWLPEPGPAQLLLRPMRLKSIKLSERNQTPKNIYRITAFIGNFQGQICRVIK